MKLIAEKLRDVNAARLQVELYNFIKQELLREMGVESTCISLADKIANGFIKEIAKINKPVKKFTPKTVDIIPLNIGDLVQCEDQYFTVIDIDHHDNKVRVSRYGESGYWGTLNLADYDLVDVE